MGPENKQGKDEIVCNDRCMPFNFLKIFYILFSIHIYYIGTLEMIYMYFERHIPAGEPFNCCTLKETIYLQHQNKSKSDQN